MYIVQLRRHLGYLVITCVSITMTADGSKHRRW